MSKYIIKNCPLLSTSIYATGETVENECGASDNTLCANMSKGCLLKRIVDKCKDSQKQCNCSNAEPEVDCLDCSFGGRASMAQSILDEFEIYEVGE